MRLSLLIAAAALLVLPQMRADTPAGGPELKLWPAKAPGETAEQSEERDMTRAGDNLVAGRSVIRLGHVTEPTLTVFRPPAEKDTGTAVVVFPGGGYHILAMDLEGTEVCTWLNSIGVTGILVKYRVPRRSGLDKHTAALQDAQRALGIVRQRADEWNLKRIGVLGFSAGAHLAAALAAHPNERTYAEVDSTDRIACNADFAVLVYPGYLSVKEEGDRVPPEIQVHAATPPSFIVMTQDDPVRVEGALAYSLELKKASIPFELHIYAEGGHGYGLRRTELSVTSWPDRLHDWMRTRGWLATRER
jgi:acetyl esterase/lipase